MPRLRKKREMFFGDFQADTEHQQNTKILNKDKKPWFHLPKIEYSKKEAIVIESGLAGAHTARGLANRGWSVTVLEQADKIAAGASGNNQGVLYTKPSAKG